MAFQVTEIVILKFHDCWSPESIHWPPRMPKRCLTRSWTALGSLHCWARFWRAVTACSISSGLLAFSWPKTHENHIKPAHNTSDEHQSDWRALTGDSLPDVQRILTQIKSERRQHAGDRWRKEWQSDGNMSIKHNMPGFWIVERLQISVHSNSSNIKSNSLLAW